ncbi:3-hydroxyacyl-ACP dehydratase FabZ family protein [Bacteroidota bacterium]
MRFHLVDRVEEVCYDKYIIGVKCITLADDVFNEHFPGYPIFPGSLIQEGLAQLAGSFFEIIMHKRGLPVKRSVLTIVNKMKFRKPAEPGDKLIYKAEVKTLNDEYGVAAVTAILDGEICANGEMIFNFFDIPNEILQQSREQIYEICMRNAKVINSEG